MRATLAVLGILILAGGCTSADPDWSERWQARHAAERQEVRERAEVLRVLSDSIR